MDRTKQLAEETVGRLLFMFSMPAIIGMMVNAIYNIVDRIFVGRGVGTLALSGIAISFPINMLLMAFGMLIGVGATALISIKLGQNKKDEAENIIGNAVTLLLLISVFMCVFFGLFTEKLLILFGASPEVLPYAKEFVYVIILGIPAMSIGFGMNNFIRAEGNPKTAMMSMLIAAGLNIILNPLFIFVFHLGVAGSALATVCSQTVVAVWVLAYFLGKRSHLKLRRCYLRIRGDIVKQIIAIGLSPFATQFVAGFIIVLINNRLALYGGDMAIAAFGVINAVSMVILMPIFGLAQGVQPIIGYNFGARNMKRVKEALKYVIISATAVCCTGFLLVELFPGYLIELFSEGNVEFTATGIQGLRIFLAMLPIVGMQIMASQYFQATGRAKQAIFLSMSRQVVFLIPALYVLPSFFKLAGVWAAGPASDLASLIVSMMFLFWDLRRI
ncbi:MAG: MATE family efflux transporter [Peptococcaceae bacterium]|nr:MATE family efflux transporter [Peptococcaceae bacterium]